MLKVTGTSASGGEGGEATVAKTPRKHIAVAIYPSFLGPKRKGLRLGLRPIHNPAVCAGRLTSFDVTRYMIASCSFSALNALPPAVCEFPSIWAGK